MPGRASELGQPIPGYEVLELLGSGGMSSVYRARQRGLDRVVAIKVIRRDQLDPGTALARLTKEAQMLARLDHPGIVRSIDFGETGDLVYFVMELVEGRSCKELLAERGRLPLRDVLTIGERVATALAHAATHAVVHRDVKPGNILLGRDGSVKLTDFGLARATSDRSLTKAGITVGTPQYMSPEQVKSPRRVDLRSDFYSLGATLYHLATGRPPFEGETVGEILHEVLYGRPVPPEQIDPSLPPAFSRLLARLLARDPARRYASGAALLDDLARVRAALDSGSGAADVGLSWQDAGEPPPVRWLPWTLVAAGVIVAVASGAALWHSGRGAEPTDSRAAEQRVVDDLRGSLESGTRSSAAIAFDVVRLKDEGTLTAASSAARIELQALALDRFNRDVAGAVTAASLAAKAALGRGDFAAARRAFDEHLAAESDRIVPGALKSTLPQVLPEFDAVLRRAGGAGLVPLDALAESVGRHVRDAFREARDQGTSRFSEALERPDFAAAKQAIARQADLERAACGAATREALLADHVALAAEVTDDTLMKGWPEAVLNELNRDPVEGYVEWWRRDLERAISRCRQDIERKVDEALRNDLEDVQEGDVAARDTALRTQIAPLRDALVAADEPTGEIDRRLDVHRKALDERVASRKAQAAADELTRLLDGDGDAAHPGLDDLLRDRRVADARARLDATKRLADDDRARWNDVITSLESSLSLADAGLRAKAGTDVDLRDRRGVGRKGKLVDEGAGVFRVGTIGGLRAADLALESLVKLLPTNALDARAQLLATSYFGDPKARAALDATLATAGDDPVIAHLRVLHERDRNGAAFEQKRRETDAANVLQELNDALAKEDATRAAAAWSRLDHMRGTEAARKALMESDRIEHQIDALRTRSRREARLAAIAPHASERVDEREAGVRLTYDFTNPDQGLDFGLTGDDVRVENGRMHFSGSGPERRARLYGPMLPFPLDRKAKASLEIELTPSLDAPGDPHFVGVRLGALCVAFYRPPAPPREEYPPQLLAWFGNLDEIGRRAFKPELGQTQPPDTTTRFEAVGLERGVNARLRILWSPGASGGGNGEIWLDGKLALAVPGTMTTPPDKDAIELRSAHALDIETLRITGRLRE